MFGGAAPVAAHESVEMLNAYADEIVCLNTPLSFYEMGPGIKTSIG